MLGEDVLYLTVRELGELVRRREISPLELAESYLARLEEHGLRLNAVVTITRERALEEARLAEAEIRAGRYRGPLHGIPYGAKDLLAARGYPTTWGAAPYRDQVFHDDATVVRKLREAGAVLVAKLAMVELAGGMGYRQANASFTGPGLNPWNTSAWSGGSSSGSGSAVAGALVAFAIGSETSGSILTPAAFCGVAGLRPTYGRVSRAGAMALSWTMDKIGPLCRSADDCGLVLAAIAGHDPADPASADLPYRYPPETEPRRPYRLAIPKDATERVQDAVRENFERTLEVLSEFATFEEVELPDFPYGAVTGTIIGAEGASAFEDLIRSGRIRELTAPEDRIGGYARLTIFATDYLRAMRIRRAITRALDELARRFDAIVAPTRATVANPVDVPFPEYFRGTGGPPIIAATNLAGIPAVSVPNGFGERGLPTAIQFNGRAWAENRILAIARAYQSRTDWHRRRPPVGGAPR
jgi:aspartyl-tRNA(Asn)/glutamyl-tRNA(Gln) amidotransferase subunit A